MQQKRQFERRGRIIFRSPLLPLKNIFNPIDFNQLVHNHLFLSALYIASPVLYEEVIRYRNGQIDSDKEKQKIEESVSKYFLRMSSRCTPFGLFSACGSLEQDVDTTDTITLPPASSVIRRSRLDMNYLCALSLYISKLPEVILEFKFYANTSVYSMGNKWRYIEYYYSSGNRIHQISSVDQDGLVNKIIKASQRGVSFFDVREIVSATGIECSDEEILSYFKDLITSNVLISELEPAITGEDVLSTLIDKLHTIKKHSITELNSILSEVKRLLNKADQSESFEGLVDIYKEVIKNLKQIDVQLDESKLFQVDSFWDLNVGASLGEELYSDVDEAVDILQKLSSSSSNDNLKNFVKRFIERYEEQEVGLMQVLDTESGIGYKQELRSENPTQNNMRWGSKETILYSKLQNCLIRKEKKITLDEKDINDLKNNDHNILAPSFTILFRAVENDDKQGNKILIEHLGGSSTANILGRFASNDAQINDHVKSICSEEEHINDDVVFAEIVHLPQSRLGNILLHPPFRNVEIPYMSRSSLSLSNQILLEDLLISVKNNKVILRSKRLNKIIIPRLSNAHNFSLGSQPVYHFLCDLQFQGISQWLAFDWGDLARVSKFLPQIAYKNIILQPGLWNFTQDDLKKFLGNPLQSQHQNFKDFCKEYDLPAIFLLSDIDNDLPVNTDDTKQIDMLINTIKNKRKFVIKEFLASSKSLQDQNKNTYNNQFVFSYIKKEETYKVNNLPQNKKNHITRTFTQDSEWIYFKIYCGVKTSNDILRHSIYTCVQKLKKEKLIDSWFFIRYADPHHHIRLRFHVSSDTLGTKEKIISKLMSSIKYFEKTGLIWNVTLDTYKREIERYRDIIEDAEKLFSFDSNATVRYLKYNTEDDKSWWMYAVKAIDQTFDDFGLSLQERQAVVNTLCVSFNKEFKVGKNEKTKLDTMYRERSKTMFNIIENKELSEDQIKISSILSKKSSASKSTIRQMFLQFPSEQLKKERKFEFLPSYIHMLMNRLCMTEARQEEMILYNLMLKYYTSKIGRIKYNQTVLL